MWGSAAAVCPAHLQVLDLSCNQLQSLSGLEELASLRELYLANNHVRSLQDLQPLKRLRQLRVLDMTGNDVCGDPNFRKFVVFHLRSLEVRASLSLSYPRVPFGGTSSKRPRCLPQYVDGQEVVDGDLVAARETFGGCLDRDALLTRYSWRDLSHLVELRIPRAELRQVGCVVLSPIVTNIHCPKSEGIVTYLFIHHALQRVRSAAEQGSCL